MIFKRACSIGLLSIMTLGSLAEDSLPALKDGKVPKTIEELWGGYAPAKEPLETAVLKEWEEDGVVLRVVRYRIGTFKGQAAFMCAVYGFPKGGSRLPGLVQIHGGGQFADYRAPLFNAKRGYATISLGWAGRINAPGYSGPTTEWGALDAYHAPSKNEHNNNWELFTPAPWTLDAVESPRNSNWFLCALAGRRALTFLEQQPEVDPGKLGVYGHSMGGKITVMIAAADVRVKAAAPSCGGISDREPGGSLLGRRINDRASLSRICCPIVFLSPANDFHGRIDDLGKAVREITSTEWRLTCAPHHNHQDTVEYMVAGPLWFDQHLKRTFTFPQTPEASLVLKTSNSIPAFTVRADGAKTILSVDIYYTEHGQLDGEKDDMANTVSRFWHHADARRTGTNTWTAELPVSNTGKSLWVYANVLYPLDAPVTGAGYYYERYTATQFSLSSMLCIATPEQLKQAGVTATAKPSLLIEAFAQDWQKEWFTYDLKDNWARRTHKLYDEVWQAPPSAKLALDIRSAQPNTLMVGLDGYAAEVPLNSGSKWQNVMLVPADFRNSAGALLADWKGIKELRLYAKDEVTSKDGPAAGWRGVKPEFHNLRWVENSR